MKEYKYILLDLDGTITDPRSALPDASNTH